MISQQQLASARGSSEDFSPTTVLFGAVSELTLSHSCWSYTLLVVTNSLCVAADFACGVVSSVELAAPARTWALDTDL